MPDRQPPPEIERLREQSWQGDGLPRHDTVFLLDAIQAVRDTEARVRDHYALSGRALREVGEAVRNSTLTDAQKVGVIAGVLANGPLDDAPGGPCEGAVFAARREAFREAVEALRELAETESGEAATALRGAALLLAARLSPDNPEGNA